MNITEKSTCIITCTFRDETDALATIASATWSLYNTANAIVNSRSSVALSVVGGVGTIVLTGNDLAIGSGDSGKRRLLVEATYNSTNGVGLYLKKEYSFTITDLVTVS